jgi:predicted AAA+ superfamily ATPase
MLAITEADIRKRLERDNPWWVQTTELPIPEAAHPRRVYFNWFKDLALNYGVQRAAVLLGPRRVGKTFMLKQLISEVINNGVDPRSILYASIDTPVYFGISLERFIDFMPTETSSNIKVVIFDEIQYLRDWEIHLKDLIDSHNNVKFIASGSAAAALRLKSQESGAGRFSEFMLPPLTFFEFLKFLGENDSLIEKADAKAGGWYKVTNIEKLNLRFVDYLNFGGYPEAVFNEAIRKNPEQFIRNDIVDKVLLKDLPNLYGINEIQELNRLFSFLAYNAGNEASLENICQESGISKPTIKRYIEYLESAFLLIKVPNVDDNCKSLKRERNFKIYLNNPSMRAALFGPVSADDSTQIGRLAECAVFSQWQHSSSFRLLRYARWRNEGELDIVLLAGQKQSPLWVGEIKWSDRLQTNRYDETKSMQYFIQKHASIRDGFFSTKTLRDSIVIDGRTIHIIPTALYCYTIGRNVTAILESPMPMAETSKSEAAE